MLITLIRCHVGKLLSIYETVEKIIAVLKKVVACMDNNYFFCSFSGNVRGLLKKDSKIKFKGMWLPGGQNPKALPFVKPEVTGTHHPSYRNML